METLTACIALVGWSTSSLRRRDELPKVIMYLYTEPFFSYFNIMYSYDSVYQLKRKSGGDKYPHIVNVETTRIASPQEVASEAKVDCHKNIDMEGLLFL